MPVWPQPMVMFASPAGCPSLASAAPETKMGRREGKPRMVVEGLHWEMGRRTRALKKKREKARAFSRQAERERIGG